MRAIRAHPQLLAGPDAADALLPAALDGWVGKGGAEGLFCAVSGDGLGVALKVADGEFRAVVTAFHAVLDRLGIGHPELEDGAVRNAHGEIVGRFRLASS